MNKRRITATASIMALVASGAISHVGAASVLPENLNVPATQTLALETQAVGVQIYVCKTNKNDSARFEWALKAPAADLFDNTGKKIGTHYAGPTWEASDGSKAVGEVRVKADAPEANAIPWLLLDAKSTSGTGILGRVATIQRLNTVGGKAPTEGCTQAQVETEVRVPYTATYHFYVNKS